MVACFAGLKLPMADNPQKWRGSFENFEIPKAPLVIVDLPIKWLDSEYRKTGRKDVLKDIFPVSMRFTA